MATTYRIHPAIGIARLGNATPEDGDHWFPAPESDDAPPFPTYKPKPGVIAKQGAVFRIYEFADGKPAREVLPGDGTKIVWKVHLANRKATLNNLNPGVPESKLVIDAGEKSISGKSQAEIPLAGTFQGKGSQPQKVVLGHLRTDAEGRLIVLAGAGKSFSPTGVKIPPGSTIHVTDWCDDTADGPVRAELQLPGGQSVPVESAWVVTAPPDYAPPVRDAISLYDLMYQKALEKFGKHYDPLLAAGKVSFKRHVYPILERVVRMWWTSEKWGEKNYLAPEVFRKLKSNNPLYQPDRKEVYDDIKSLYMAPAEFEAAWKAFEQTSLGGEPPAALAQALSFEGWQDKVLLDWVNGGFVSDFELPLTEEPWLTLDKAILASCRGNAFNPGLEVAKIVANQKLYNSPFRIDPTGAKPGSLTLGLSVPWQADFFQVCESFWPPRRPHKVFRGKERKQWSEGATTGEEGVKKWAQMGFVLSSGESWEKDRNL